MQCTERGIGTGRGRWIPTSRFPNVRELLRCHNKLARVEMAPLKNKQNELDCPQLSPSSLSKVFFLFLDTGQQIIMVLLLCVNLTVNLTACKFSIDTCQ